ncbi:porin [Xanthomonas arboricola]|uniref:carbohydrate porin n=1 Tax=Xanthomonas TaxID=338 RepID=UPI0015E280BE|nr:MULTISPECIES: carbohydrate porin [Xanthomonas]MBB5737685.1 porin [Xanthomonas sp. CFBP 8152]
MLLTAVALTAGPAAALAQDGDTATSAAAPPQRPPETSPGPGGFAAWKADLEARGITFALGYRSEDLAAVSGVDDHDLVHAGQIALTTLFDMERLAGWPGASITASLAYRDGDNINDRSAVGALLGPQEIYGRGHDLRLTQFWLDQSLFGNRLQLRLGRLAPGEDFQATECSFTNLSFCANQPGNYVADYWFNWPISQWGITVQGNLDATRYLKIGAYQVNQRNLRGNLWEALSPRGGSGVLVPFQFGWNPTSADGRISEYTIGGWYSGADRQDVYADIAGGPASASGLPFRWRDGAHGAFVSAVRQLTRGRGESAKSGLRAVVKASVADRATSTVDRTFAATFVYTGASARRPLDDVGVAIAFNHLNDRVADYRAERLALGQQAPLPGDGERTIEAYYSFRFGSVVMIRPDIQWIRHPGGISRRDDVVIVGVRTEITF